jgi:hypothetical protein
MSVKIKQLEPQFAQRLGTPLRTILHELRYSVPEHYQLQVSLLDANGRKKRSDASAENWSPESGRIEIRFQPTATQLRGEPASGAARVAQTGAASAVQAERVSDSSRGSTVDVHPAEADLLKALDRAESTPGWSFVPLKKFRDEILPSEHIPSIPTDVHHQNVLRQAIEKRLILVGKVPNPKAPQFPVTTIRVNRLMPEVRAALGQADNPDLDFHPIEISGEPLSATILRERR